jgi:hypothetical protein
MCKLKNAPTIGSSSVYFEKKRSKHNVTAQAEWREKDIIDLAKFSPMSSRLESLLSGVGA